MSSRRRAAPLCRTLVVILSAASALGGAGVSVSAAPSDPPEATLSACEPTPDARCASWAATYDSGGRLDSQAAGAASSTGDRVFMTGSDDVSGTAGADIVTAAFDRTGEQVWATPLIQSGVDHAKAIAVNPDDSLVVLVGGEQLAHPNAGDASIVALDANTGGVRWRATYDGGTGYDLGVDLAFAPDGSTVYVSILSKGAGGNQSFDYVTLALGAADGARRWATASSSAPGEYDAPAAIAVAPSGDVVATTGSMRAPSGNALTFGTVVNDATTGEPLWQVIGGTGSAATGTAYDLAFGPGGNELFVTGTSYLPDGRKTWVTTAFDSRDGSELWRDWIHEGCVLCDVRSLAVDRETGPGGARDYRVYVGGSEFDFRAVAYEAAGGARAWASEWDGGGREILAKTALSADGRSVYVAGVTQRSRAIPSLVPDEVPNPYRGYLAHNDPTVIALDRSTGALDWSTKITFEEYEDEDMYVHRFDVREHYDASMVIPAPGRLYLSNSLTRRSQWKPCCGLFLRPMDEFDTRFVAVAIDDPA